MGILSKFIRGFASIFTRKSIGEKVWARLFAGYGAYGLPGAWSADRRELALHYRGWSYIAVRVIAEEIAALQPQVGFVRSPQDYEERIGEVLKSCHPGRERQAEQAFRKRFRSRAAVRKSLAQLQEHEEIELVDNDHRLLRLLRNPNNWDTGYTFWFRTSMQLDIHGNFYWWCIPDGTGRTVEIWVLPSNWVWPSPNRNKEEIVSFYEVRPYGTPGAASSFVIPASEIVHGMYPGPISMWDGFSPQTAMAPWIDVLESMDACQFAGFKNGVGFDATIELDAAMEDPEQATLKRLQERLKERSGEGHHKEPLVMAPGAKLTYPRGVAPYEMDYGTSGDQKKDWVLAGWGVSKFMAGLSEDVNKASSRTAVANFFRKVIRPRLLLIDGYATENLARELDDRLIVYHDDPTADDPEETRANITLAIQAKAITINEVRTDLLGKEPIEGGDVIIGTPTDTPLLGPDAAENADELGEILATLKEAQQPEQPGMPGMPGMNGNGRSETGPTNRLPQMERNGKHVNGVMRRKNVKDKEGHEHDSGTGQFTSGGGGSTATATAMEEKPSKPENKLPSEGGKTSTLKITPVGPGSSASGGVKFSASGNVIEGSIAGLPITTSERGLIGKLSKKTKAALEETFSDPEVQEALRSGRVDEVKVEPTKGGNKPKSGWTAGVSGNALIIHPKTADSIEESKIEERRQHGLKRVIHHETGHSIWNVSMDAQKDAFAKALKSNPKMVAHVSRIVNVAADPNAFNNTGSRVVTEAFAEVSAMRKYDKARYESLPEELRSPVEAMHARAKQFADMTENRPQRSETGPTNRLPKAEPSTNGVHQ